jgi:hypothetical protein
MVYSTGDLTRDVVHGDGQPAGEPPLDTLFDDSDGKDLARDLRRREQAAAAGAEERTALP